jgi:uncharacterized protein with NAD-binding domain and iron-sulfur cluster
MVAKPIRVAVIGAGPAGLTAALELTSDHRDGAYDVTVYVPGWRPGGKCASGRNPGPGTGDCIEEHGLHVWFGCYDNARHILEECYRELAEAGDDYAFGSFDDAFERVDYIVLGQRDRGTWAFNEVCFPRNHRPPLNFGGFVGEALTWTARTTLQTAHPDLASTPSADAWYDSARPVLQSLDLPEAREGRRADQLARGMSRLHRSLTSRSLNDNRLKVLHRPPGALERFGDLVAAILPEHPEESAETRFYRDTVRLLFAVLRGIWRDDLLSKGFDAINHLDLAEWLKHHDLELEDDPTEWPALLRAVYDGCFAFEDGDPQKPRMAAGRALQGAIRCLFHYRGSVLYRPRGSMSDVLIAPMTRVLERRENARIRYFSPASELRPDAAGRRIAEIDIVQQLAVADGSHSFTVKGPAGGTVDSWSTTFPKHLLPDAKVDASRLEFEINPFGGKVSPVQDFDWVILAVPPGVQEVICRPLAALDPAYAAMLNNAESVATQAVQLWLGPTAIELGQAFRSDSLMSCFVEPLDTYADMAHITEHERWMSCGKEVGHIAYLCGVLPHATVTTQKEADAHARRELARFVEEDMTAIWPRLNENGGKSIVHQYSRANWCPTERYVLTLPGSLDHRLGACGTRFENLVLAGDWTANGFDAGCLEAAVTSGRLAAQAICGFPRLDDIPGINGPPGFPNHIQGAARAGRLRRLQSRAKALWSSLGLFRRITIDNPWTRR